MQRIAFDTPGQELVHTPPRPVTSASFVLEDLTRPASSGERVLAEGPATVSALVLELEATAGPREPAATKIDVVETGVAEAGAYWLAGPDGLGELVFVESIVADAYLVARHPLIGTYPAGSTIRPMTIRADFPDELAARVDLAEAETPLRVVWRYELDGRPQTAQEQVRIQRQIGGEFGQSEVIELVRTGWPDLVARMPKGAKLEGWVRYCTRLVSSRIRAQGIAPERFLAGDRGPELVAARVVLHCAQNGDVPGNMDKGEFLALAKDAWSSAWTDLVVGLGGTELVELDGTTSSGKPTRAPHGLSLGL